MGPPGRVDIEGEEIAHLEVVGPGRVEGPVEGIVQQGRASQVVSGIGPFDIGRIVVVGVPAVLPAPAKDRLPVRVVQGHVADPVERVPGLEPVVDVEQAVHYTAARVDHLLGDGEGVEVGLVVPGSQDGEVWHGGIVHLGGRIHPPGGVGQVLRVVDRVVELGLGDDGGAEGAHEGGAVHDRDDLPLSHGHVGRGLGHARGTAGLGDHDARGIVVQDLHVHGRDVRVLAVLPGHIGVVRAVDCEDIGLVLRGRSRCNSNLPGPGPGQGPVAVGLGANGERGGEGPPVAFSDRQQGAVLGDLRHVIAGQGRLEPLGHLEDPVPGLNRVVVRRAVEVEAPDLVLGRRPADGQLDLAVVIRGGPIARNDLQVALELQGEVRRVLRADGDGVCGLRGRDAGKDVPLDRGLEASGHVLRVQCVVVGQGALDGVLDPGVVGPLGIAVVHGRNRDRVRLGPVVVARRVRAEGEGGGVGAGLAVRHIDRDGYIAQRLPGEQDLVGVLGVRGNGFSGPFGHHRVVVLLGDHHIGRVVIDHLGHHAEGGDPVVGAAVVRPAPLDHAVLDVEVTYPLRQGVVRGDHLDLLGNEPVGPVEEQGDALPAGRVVRRALALEQDALAAGPRLGLAGKRRRGRDPDLLLGGAGEHHRVGGMDQPFRERVKGLLEHPDGLLHVDDHPGLVVVRHIGRDVLHEEVVEVDVAEIVHAVLDQAAVPLEAVAHHVDGLVPGAAGHVEGVAAQSAVDLGVHSLVGAGDEEGVVPLQAVDRGLLDPGVGDVESRAEDALVRDDEVIAVLRADDGQGVQAVAAVDAHGCVHRVGDEVRALPAVDVRVRGLGVVRVHPHESPDPEGVVVLLAVEVELGLVPVHVEGVVARPAVQGGRPGDAVAQVAPGGEGGVEPVLRAQPVVRVALVPRRLEHLAHLELVFARVAVYRHRRARIVEDEGVVAVPAEHEHAGVDAVVVVHPLDVPSRDRLAVGVHLHGRDGARAEQEEVFLGRGVDQEAVRPVVRALVVHVEQG